MRKLENIIRQKEQLISQLDDINEALNAFENNNMMMPVVDIEFYRNNEHWKPYIKSTCHGITGRTIAQYEALLHNMQTDTKTALDAVERKLAALESMLEAMNHDF